jgi:hypothetical protein
LKGAAESSSVLCAETEQTLAAKQIAAKMTRNITVHPMSNVPRQNSRQIFAIFILAIKVNQYLNIHADVQNAFQPHVNRDMQPRSCGAAWQA